MTYDVAGNPLSIRDANGKLTGFTYDTFGRRLTQTDQLNRTRSFTYDAMGRVLTETDPRNGVTRSVYDSLGRKTSITDALNGVTRMEYDNEGNKTADVDALGRRTTHAYDAENRKTLTTYPDSATMGATFNFRGDKLTETDQLGRVTKYEYDKAGQLLAVTKAFGTADAGTMRYSYDLAGRKLTETDERGNVTTFGYDDAGRQTRMTNALGQVTQYGYDGAGLRTSMTEANGRLTRYTFDARRRMTVTTFADNTTMRYSYDGMRRQLTTTDQSGRVTTKGYDDAGQLTSVTDALNQITRYGYDGNGNLISQTDAAGRVTAYQWDALNRRTRRTLPMGMFETVSYDAVGNTTSRMDFNGRTTTYLYDTLNRLTRKTPDASFFATPVQYGYLGNGLRASMSDVSGATTYSYDARNRLATKTTPQGALSYGHDARGNVTSMQSSNVNGTWVNYGYDAVNRVATVVDRRLPSGTTTYSYDVVGNQGRVVYPNGVQHEYVYDGLDRLTSLPITGSGLMDRHNYSVAPTGHRLSTTRLNGRTSSYGYDATYKLVQEIISGDPTPANNGSLTYGYDSVGNRSSLASTLGAVASRTYGYDLNDRLNGDTHDANGNTLTSGGTTYLYDFEDRLIRANTVNLLYDGDGHRVRKTVGANVTSYLIDELNPTGYSQVVDEIVNGAVQRTYTYGLQRISQNWPTPTLVSNFYVYDGHGSVRALTDAGGGVTDAYEYDAFGNLVANSGTTLNHNLYVGEQFDSDLGLYYLRSRWYRPSVGRLLTTDKFEGDGRPLRAELLDVSRGSRGRAPGSRPRPHHLYVYVDSDPANQLDPSGYSLLWSALRSATAAETITSLTVVINAGGGGGLAQVAIGVITACRVYLLVETIRAAVALGGNESPAPLLPWKAGACAALSASLLHDIRSYRSADAPV